MKAIDSTHSPAQEQTRDATGAALPDSADLFVFAPVGYFSLGRDSGIRRCNLAGADLLERERSALVGCAFTSFIAIRDAGNFDGFLKDVFSDGAPKACELDLLLAGREPRSVLIKAALSPDRQECLAVVIDITSQKQVERALLESERRFRDVADISADWIWEVDTDGRYTYASESVRKLLGYAPEEIIGKTAFDLMPTDEAARVGAAFAAIAARGEAFRELENIVVDVHGGWHDTLTNGTPIRDANGKVVGYRGVDRDITERKRTEQALTASQQRLRDMVNTTNGIVWEADARTFDFTFISQQAERLLGFPVADWLQPGFWLAHLHPDDLNWAPEYCMSCTRRLAPHDFEYRFIARDGRTVWLHDLVTVVAENGSPRWLRGIMVDVTSRRLAEDRLREMAGVLEARVAERTAQLRRVSAELTMTEERERRKLAQYLHDELSQLLAVIKIKLTSMEAGSQAAEIGRIAALIDQADQTARNISQQLSPPLLQTLGLMPAIERLADEIEGRYGLAVHVDPVECRRRFSDEVQAVLYRAARELLINVAKHAGVREASLTCLCDHKCLTLVVSDAGCGFDPVAQLGEGGDPRRFGLRSVRERIANIGGSMEVDSSPGNGATIAIVMPCDVSGEEVGDDPDNACR